MGATNAYCCDGPDCSELTTKAPNTQAPSSWLRLTLRAPGTDDKVKVHAFHHIACAHAWLDDQLDVTEASASRNAREA